VLQAQSLSKIYRTPRGDITALANLDLALARGQSLAVCGRSGSGKSTLLAIIGGLCRPTSGNVQVDGADILSLPPHKLADFRGRSVGFVFQFASLLSNLRAIDNVALPGLIGHEENYAAVYERATTLLQSVGLADRWDAYPAELSGGQQRRVAIARAMINRPPLLLADEPTSDLDEETEREVFSLLLDMHRAHNTTLLMVTHNMALAEQTEQVMYLDGGRIAFAPHVGLLRKRDVAPALNVAAAPYTAVQDPAAHALNVETVGAAVAPSGPALVPQPAHTAGTAEQTVPLGAGLGRFLADFAVWAVAIALCLVAVNYGAALVQRRSIVREQVERRAAEDLALQSLRADLDNVVQNEDGSYELTIFLASLDQKRELYVMGPSLRAFVQVDRSWQAIPIAAADQQADQVTKIDEKRLFRFTFRPNVASFDQLIKGYLHIRFINSMIVAEQPAPSSDVFDRTDDYYIYLRAPDVSDDEVRQANRWSDTTLVPRWIPMKAH
jgi:putative ABC transport system ATP-binding protein/macrolide transport system ATP-binding/permease protein/lipoprotein-releasing system ATP-binding protein